MRLPLHLEEHLLLGQVLLLRGRLSLRGLPVAATLLRACHLLLLLLLVELILLDLLHQEDLLLLRQLLLCTLTASIRAPGSILRGLIVLGIHVGLRR